MEIWKTRTAGLLIIMDNILRHSISAFNVEKRLVDTKRYLFIISAIFTSHVSVNVLPDFMNVFRSYFQLYQTAAVENVL